MKRLQPMVYLMSAGFSMALQAEPMPVRGAHELVSFVGPRHHHGVHPYHHAHREAPPLAVRHHGHPGVIVVPAPSPRYGFHPDTRRHGHG